MKALLLLLSLLVSVSAVLADDAPKTTPQPEGQPAYMRGSDGWSFGCWNYTGAQVVHCRLRNTMGEAFGSKDGETITTNLGTLIWRGHYSPHTVPDKSTGWLFVESFSGPPFIRDGFGPEKSTLK